MISFLLILITALFFPGIILRIKSITSGRKGPDILQPWKNILILLRKSSTFSSTTSYIFQIAPVIYITTIICAMLLMPFAGYKLIFGFNGDFILFAYLLALGKFFFILSAMDTGSSFEGMGANREALYSMLVEPAFFILIGTIALLTGYTSMQEIFANLQLANHYYFIISIILIYLLIQIAMIENSRMPVDDPKTHLELTMIHEVMILDHCGFDLALIQIGTTLKFAIYGTFIANFVIPVNLPIVLQLSIYFSTQIIFAAIIGFLESFRARKKLMKNPQFIVSLSSIALVAFILSLLLLHQMLK
ncbi:MAG: NADH-quinone oxidoreductase subunit H [Bacteroidales bacterium]|jgi:formate hydrogenlyase subunit 4